MNAYERGQLQQMVERWDKTVDAAKAVIADLHARIAGVVALHTETPFHYCAHCRNTPWPCPTVCAAMSTSERGNQ